MLNGINLTVENGDIVTVVDDIYTAVDAEHAGDELQAFARSGITATR